MVQIAVIVILCVITVQLAVITIQLRILINKKSKKTSESEE